MRKLSIALASLVAMLVVTSAQARDQIKIVGSSTVFPYATIVAERFGSSGKFKTPVIESTGTGGGAKLFCAGVGTCLLYTSPSPRDIHEARMTSSA